jgi:hypothetical protein
MDEEQFKELLRQYVLMNASGKTGSQRLNYAQDLMGATGVDLFNLAPSEDWVPSESEFRNPTGEIWGSDPGAGAVFDFMSQYGMSPKEAVDEARAQGLVPKYSSYDSADKEVDYLKIANDFAKDELGRADWERRMVDEQTKFESARKPGLGDLTKRTVFEQMGSPTVDSLVAQYAARRNPDVKTKSVSAPYVPKKNASKESKMYGEYAQYRGNPQAQKVEQTAAGAKGFSSNPVIEKFAQQEARGDVGRILDRSKKRFVVTPESEKVLRTLSMLQMLGND